MPGVYTVVQYWCCHEGIKQIWTGRHHPPSSRRTVCSRQRRCCPCGRRPWCSAPKPRPRPPSAAASSPSTSAASLYAPTPTAGGGEADIIINSVNPASLQRRWHCSLTLLLSSGLLLISSRCSGCCCCSLQAADCTGVSDSELVRGPDGGTRQSRHLDGRAQRWHTDVCLHTYIHINGTQQPKTEIHTHQLTISRTWLCTF